MATVEDTRVIVDEAETFEGKIVPTVRSEIDRPVTVHEDATVTEGIYGGTVSIEPGAAVEGSVMAKEGVDLADCAVRGGVGTPGRVEAEGAHVEGTVTGTRVRLENCVVRGNVVGTEAILENCVVLGMAVGENRLDLRDSVCYTFKSMTEAVLADTDVVLPQAVVDGRLDLQTPIGVVGLGEIDGVDGDAGRITLTEDDLVEHDGTRYLSIADRVLDLERVRDRVDELERQLEAAVVEGAGGDALDLDRLGVEDLPPAGGVVDDGSGGSGGTVGPAETTDHGADQPTSQAEVTDDGTDATGEQTDTAGDGADEAGDATAEEGDDDDDLFDGLFPGSGSDDG